jgi:ATP-dependent RNA helicase DeaD
MSDPDNNPIPGFDTFSLNDEIIKVLTEIGYETPSPIQAKAIPPILAGRDVVGQAQTGTGKTAAFALPVLSNIDLQQQDPQVLVLAPTRELAIQVAEAFQKYGSHLKGLHVLPIYGGGDYGTQFRALKRGVHVVVGTPGRVMDHIRRGSLNLDNLRVLVLDEADEMLRMGFIDDVTWVLEQTPPDRQIALFSATMPPPIRKIAKQHLSDPEEITIEVKTTTADTIHQRFWMVGHAHKLDALTRILDFEEFDGMLIFVRTKSRTVELAEKLEARGHACAALNGDVPQNQRERTVDNLKKGKVDILIATDVAARGLDVDRISHVINYDIPYDTESYVHRVGRTGRAGRKGEAILFVSPREKHMLAAIERATRQRIERLKMPSTEDINDRRVAQFKQRITDTIAQEDLGIFPDVVEQYVQEHDCSPLEVAAALARLLQGSEPLLLEPPPKRRPEREKSPRAKDATRKATGEKPIRTKDKPRKPAGEKPARANDTPRRQTGETIFEETGEPIQFETFRLEVGTTHGATPNAIVGAIANEAGLEGKYIGQIDIRDEFTIIDLPAMPADIFRLLQRVRVAGQRLLISHLMPDEKPTKKKDKKPAGPKKHFNPKAKGPIKKRKPGHRKGKAVGPRKKRD